MRVIRRRGGQNKQLTRPLSNELAFPSELASRREKSRRTLRDRAQSWPFASKHRPVAGKTRSKTTGLALPAIPASNEPQLPQLRAPEFIFLPNTMNESGARTIAQRSESKRSIKRLFLRARVNAEFSARPSRSVISLRPFRPEKALHYTTAAHYSRQLSANRK